MKEIPINEGEFDEFIENDENILSYANLAKTRRKNLDALRANVDFPVWMIRALDKEAAHLGVARQALIKMWVAEKLKKVA